MSDCVGVALTVVLLALNALFVAAEFALISARRTQLEPRVAGRVAAGPAWRCGRSRTSRWSMAAAQLGITICSLGLGAVGEPAIAHLMEPAFEARQRPARPGASDLVRHRDDDRGVPPRRARRDGAQEPRARRPRPRRADPRPVHAGGRRDPQAVRGVAQRHRQPHRPAVPGRAQRRGRLDLHPRRGRRPGRGVASRGSARRARVRPGVGALDFSDGTIDQVLLPREGLVTIKPSATPVDVEKACAETGFSRFPVSDADGRHHGLPAHQGRARDR